MTTVSSACTCLEVFGEDPDCPLHSYDALEARIADLEELIEAQHGDVVVRTAKLLYEKDNKIAALSAEADRLREALKQARRTMRNCAGAIQSGQIVDKEVDRNLRRGYEAIDAALQQGSAKQ